MTDPTIIKVRHIDYTNRPTDIFDLVISDIVKRGELGWQQHHRPLTAASDKDWLQELYEELLDACIYLRGLLEQRVDAAACRQPETPPYGNI